MEAVVQCGKFAMRGSRSFGRLLFFACGEVREAEEKQFVRQMKPFHHRFLLFFISVSPVSSVVKSAIAGAAPLRYAVFEISSVPPSERPINC
jgi:hypothetical protein